MGDSRLTHEVSKFLAVRMTFTLEEFCRLYIRENRPTTWSASIHSVRQRPEVYDAHLEEFPKGYRDKVGHEYSLPPTDRRSVEEDHTGIRGHPASMRPGS